jgi:DNA modification methylase
MFWEGGASMSVPNDHRPNISCDVFLCFGKDSLFRKHQAIKSFEIDTNCIPHCLLIGRQFTTHRLTPLAKPVRLFAGCVDLLSEPGDLVCDFFLSSGTTIIACAKTGRRCFGIELSPAYCDVIRRRWTKFAKENGQIVGSGGLE